MGHCVKVWHPNTAASCPAWLPGRVHVAHHGHHMSHHRHLATANVPSLNKVALPRNADHQT